MKRAARPVLSVVLPCLDEADGVALAVREAFRGMASARVSGEVIVADNGSSDGSPLRAREAGARVVKIRRRGYGSAIRGGVGVARGRWILIADADASYDLGRLKGFISALRKGADLVQGSRLAGSIARGAMPWTHRHIGTPVFNSLLGIFFGLRVSDSQSGMRALTARAWRTLAPASAGMEINSEMLAKAALSGMKVAEVPIRYRRAVRNRSPHLRPWRDGFRNLSTLARLRLSGFSG